MQKTIKLKLLPDKEQEQLISITMSEYIRLANDIVADMVTFNEFGKLTSAKVTAKLPAVLKSQCIQDCKSIFKRYLKTRIEPILKKRVAIWNNQSYKIYQNDIAFPVLINGKCQRIKVKTLIPKDILEMLQNSKLGTMRITYKSHKMIAQIAITVQEEKSTGNNIMGVDLGLKCPAVCVTNTNKVKFVGNGRKNKYIRRHFKAKRRKLGKAKKNNAIKHFADKEQRIMKDIDHKISRTIINFAINNNVSIIRLEKLDNIRNTAKISRKNNYNLHTWTFYRLAQYIEYKAKLAGIKIEYVDPAYTSQTCPKCGEKHKAKDRNYTCHCGFRSHRDLVGAINICNSTVIVGNRLSA